MQAQPPHDALDATGDAQPLDDAAAGSRMAGDAPRDPALAPEQLTLHEASAYVGSSPAALRRAIGAGKLPRHHAPTPPLMDDN